MKKSNIYEYFEAVAKRRFSHKALVSKLNNKWKSQTYRKLLKKVNNFSQNLLKYVEFGEKVAIISENRPEWLISDLAINRIGAVSVPIHISATTDIIKHIVLDSKSKYAIVSKTQFRKNYKLLKKLNFKLIIVIGLEDIEKKYKQGTKAELLDFSKLSLSEPKKIKKIKKSPSLEDLASIVYTSGTGGNPKGVMLTNKNFLNNVFGVKKVIEILPSDRFFSFLPLSHVLERTAGSYVPLLSGSSIAYATDIKKIQEELKEASPSILVSVPKIFERIFEKIGQKLKNKSNLEKKLFFWAIKKDKNFWEKKLAKIFVLDKVKNQIFGKNLRFAVSGGASISKNVIKFFNDLNVDIIEGYGLTETSPITNVNSIKDKKIGSVGKSIPGVQVKLTKKKEILVKGDSVFKGYFNNEIMSQKAFTKKGWFKTGDLGFIDSEGYLTIIGRRKEIIVTSNGKNVAPSRIESLINLIPVVGNSVVLGHRQNYLTALVDLKDEIKAKEDMKISEYKTLILNEIERINKKLSPFERVKKVEILDNPLTIEGKELTPTLKIRRKIIEQKYKKLIQGMYQT